MLDPPVHPTLFQLSDNLTSHSESKKNKWIVSCPTIIRTMPIILLPADVF